jgi:hypothetical protein
VNGSSETALRGDARGVESREDDLKNQVDGIETVCAAPRYYSKYDQGSMERRRRAWRDIRTAIHGNRRSLVPDRADRLEDQQMPRMEASISTMTQLNQQQYPKVLEMDGSMPPPSGGLAAEDARDDHPDR